MFWSEKLTGSTGNTENVRCCGDVADSSRREFDDVKGLPPTKRKTSIKCLFHLQVMQHVMSPHLRAAENFNIVFSITLVCHFLNSDSEFKGNQ